MSPLILFYPCLNSEFFLHAVWGGARGKQEIKDAIASCHDDDVVCTQMIILRLLVVHEHTHLPFGILLLS